jgi:hypothetical protein
MSLVRATALFAALLVLLGCNDALESSAHKQGVSREDARDIIRQLRAEKHPHVIYAFSRVPSGILYVSTDVGDFLVEGGRPNWRFTDFFLEQPRHTSNHALQPTAGREENYKGEIRK